MLARTWPTVWRTETERSIRAREKDRQIDRERERERERERGRYTVCFVFLPSGPECESGFHCSFLVWVDDPSPSLPLPSPLPFSLYSFVCLRVLSVTPRASLPPSPSHRSTLSLFLSLFYLSVSRPFLCRSIPSRRTFKCHQTDREVGPHVSLYRVCLKRVTSATKQRNAVVPGTSSNTDSADFRSKRVRPTSIVLQSGMGMSFALIGFRLICCHSLHASWIVALWFFVSFRLWG